MSGLEWLPDWPKPFETSRQSESVSASMFPRILIAPCIHRVILRYFQGLWSSGDVIRARNHRPFLWPQRMLVFIPL
jgi:hypothetical protein